jgi:PleD family two-component response regulator
VKLFDGSGAIRVLFHWFTLLRREVATMRVLIAEDDPALASFVRKGLEAEHYAVDVTSDGEQARAMPANSIMTC